MEKLPDLKQLSNEAKEALIVELWQEIQKLTAALATTGEAKPNKVPTKTSKNSSTPPSKGFKPNIKPLKIEGVKRAGSVGRAGGGRELHPKPDQTIIAQLKNCPQCGEKVTATTQKLQSVYEKIELPPIRPIITRIERYGGQCACCQAEYVAPVPLGMEPGSPFGSSIQSLVTYLRYTHAISYERLSLIFGSVFGLKISVGAIANLLGKVKTSLDDQVSQILQRLRRAKLICSDETSARVNGQNQWEWVFQNPDVCLHVIRPSRGTRVINEVLGEHRPDIWVSDLFSAQILEDAAIPATNNSSEQAIRMSVIFRRVTNGFRSEWGRDLFAAVRSVVNTGKRQGLTAYQSIQQALSIDGSIFSPS